MRRKKLQAGEKLTRQAIQIINNNLFKADNNMLPTHIMHWYSKNEYIQEEQARLTVLKRGLEIGQQRGNNGTYR